MVETRKIGLALGSESARGWAHLGVVRALAEAGIHVDCVAGTSIGALVGAIYAAGKIDTLEDAILQLDWKRIVSFFDMTSTVWKQRASTVASSLVRVLS
jgi:NTE family protein